jgi:hypothetical protein
MELFQDRPPILTGNLRRRTFQRHPDLHCLKGLPTLPHGAALGLQPRRKGLRWVGGPGESNIRVQPTSNPRLVVGFVLQWNALVHQSFPVPNPLLRTTQGVIFFSKRGIVHNRKIFPLSTSCQAPEEGRATSSPLITGTPPQKPQFHIRKLLCKKGQNK